MKREDSFNYKTMYALNDVFFITYISLTGLSIWDGGSTSFALVTILVSNCPQ